VLTHGSRQGRSSLTFDVSQAMHRVVRTSGFGAECIEGGRVLFRRGITGISGAVREYGGTRHIKRTGGFWNCYAYEFFDDAIYGAYPLEPRLTWHLGFVRQERVESDGFSGVIMRECSNDHALIRLNEFEWRFDPAQRELYFEPPHRRVELRVTLLAFNFFHSCMPE
jgi:hypothetical protein